MNESYLPYQLRIATYADLSLLHPVFETSVRGTCRKDYTEEQINAWVQKATPERWQELFWSDLHFILMEDKRTKGITGFTSINVRGYLHSLFVHPGYQRQGIGSSLLHAAEEFARTHRADSIYSEVSKTAKPFLEANGYRIEKKQTVTIGRIRMNNFVMKKDILTENMKATITTPGIQEYDEMLQVWEASVRSTHHFLKEEDILFYKPQVKEQYFPATDLYIIRNKQGGIAAFMGLSEELIEMLFVHPDAQGKGYGTQLIDFALHKKHIYRVDVNEQNEKALAFYLHKGFQITRRDAVDSSGKPFPILHLEYAFPSLSKGV